MCSTFYVYYTTNAGHDDLNTYFADKFSVTLFFILQVLFSKTLTRMQWFSLILLTIGCMVKNVNFKTIYTGDDLNNGSVHNSSSTKMDGMGINYSTLLILIQVG